MDRAHAGSIPRAAARRDADRRGAGPFRRCRARGPACAAGWPVTDGGSDQTRIDEGGGDSSRTRGGTLAELVGRLESRDVLRSVLTGGVPLAGIEVLGITHDSRRVA